MNPTISAWTLVRILCLLCLTFLTVQGQISELWPSWLSVDQLVYHRDVLGGTAGNPWQYRVLSVYLAEGGMRLLSALGVEQPAPIVFVFLRVVQAVAIFLVARLYYLALGAGEVATWLGLGCLTWATMLGYYNSDLQFSTYFDVLFYLLAGLILARGRQVWLMVPLMAAAALNRETSGLMPLLVAGSSFLVQGRERRSRWIIAVASLCVYVAIFVWLRNVYPPQKLLGYGRGPGTSDMLILNVSRMITYVKVLGVLGILPLIGLYHYRTWPGLLRVCLWTVVPVWFVVHLLGSVLAESRLLLVPQALVFIPGALLALGRPEPEVAKGPPG